MKKWNGWGDDQNDFNFELSRSALGFLQQQIGTARPLPDATLAEALANVPASRMPPPALESIDAEQRLRHARGQSLPDWLAMRSGEFGVFPDGVALPTTSAEVQSLLQYAEQQGLTVIPYGGGTSVVGHINPEAGDRPVLTIDMTAMNQLLAFDPESQLATFGAGATGLQVEAALAARGYTLGHYPQSWELSTIGGWVASRSSGQQSLRYGRIEQMFAGGRIETPKGTLEIPSFPASAAGPDLREIFMGSEGRMGIITEVKVRVTPLPEHESFHVIFFPGWDIALEAMREIAQGKVQLSMMRLSNPIETFTQLKLAGGGMAIGLLEKYLALRGAAADKTMFTFGITGSSSQCKSALAQVNRIARRYGGVSTGTLLGKKWQHGRFRAPYLRHGLWDNGYAVDTMETAIDWVRVPAAAATIETAINTALAGDNERVHAFSHLSHIYPQGSSVYTTYVFRCGNSYEQTFARWQQLKAAGAGAIVKLGGTISHQHGVGRDHAIYLPAEKGPLGIAAIEGVLGVFDPNGMMNPGKLLP